MNHTKKINAGGINQKSMHAVSAVFVNSININVPILRTSNSICRASTCKAFSVYKQSAQCQRPMHTASTTLNSTLSQCIHPQHQCLQYQQPVYRTSATNAHPVNNQWLNINAQSINNQCALYPQPMSIASDFLMLGFSSTKTFTLCSMPLKPVILRESEGEVAESILTESSLSKGVWDDRLQRPITL